MNWNQFKPFPERERIATSLDLIPSHWALTPIGDKKAPYRTNWQEEHPLARDQIKDCLLNGEQLTSKKGKPYRVYPSGFGLRTGDISEGLLAVDVDGEGANNLLSAIAQENLPNTITWTSGKAGRFQLLFQVPLEYRERLKAFTRLALTEWNGIKAVNKDGEKEQLDFRYNGCQSVLPASYHPTTGQYEWLFSPDEVECAIAPKWLLDLLLSQDNQIEVQPNQPSVTWQQFLDDFQFRSYDSIPLVECLSRKHRQLVASGIGENSRNDTAIAIAMDAVGCERWLLAARQAFDGTAEDIIRDFGARCFPSMPPTEINTVFKSAQKSSRGSAIANKVGDEGLKALIAGYFWRREKPAKSPSHEERVTGEDSPQKTESRQSQEIEEKSSGFDLSETKRVYQELRKAVEELLDVSDALERQFLFQQIARSYKVKVEFLESLAVDIRHQKETQEFRWIEDELEEEQEQRQWICPKHLARQSVQILVAPGGSGKTILVNNLALAVAKGESFLESPCKKGKVLLCQSDTPRAEALQYFREAGFEEAPEKSVAVHYNWNFNQIDKLDDWLSHEHFDLVAIDSLAAANSGSGLDENSVLYAEGITRLNKLAEKHDTSFIVIHHANKGGDLRGSTAIRDNATELIHLKQQEESTNRELYRTKSRTGYMEKLVISLDEENYTWSIQDCDTESDVLKAEVQEKMIKHLEINAHREFTATELLNDIGSNYDPQLVAKELRSYARLGLCKSRKNWKEYKGERNKVTRFQGFVTENTKAPTSTPNPAPNPTPEAQVNPEPNLVEIDF